MSRARAFALVLTALLQGIAVQSSHAGAESSDWTSRVVKVVATRADGIRELGSAVSIAGERMVTNCHVIRGASRIEIQQVGESRPARADLRDAYRDLCFLTVPGYRAEPVPMIDVGQTRVGLNVMAVGYPAGAFSVSEGKIIGLHTCECDGGKVIQTSAPFDRGASGGGLFDQEGNLVGILSFKSTRGGNFHFALPVGWLRHMADHPMEPVGEGNTFWETPGKESAYFLAACDLGAKRNWRALSRLASEWSEKEPNNPEAWMALGRARLGLHQTDAAVTAYQRVLMLDSSRDEAIWALQQLELELGQNLLDSSGV
jgi:serine protease Do